MSWCLYHTIARDCSSLDETLFVRSISDRPSRTILDKDPAGAIGHNHTRRQGIERELQQVYPSTRFGGLPDGILQQTVMFMDRIVTSPSAHFLQDPRPGGLLRYSHGNSCSNNRSNYDHSEQHGHVRRWFRPAA